MKYSQYLDGFEARTGEKAGEFLKKFAAAMDAAMETFEKKGREDAASGKKPYTEEAVVRWAVHAIGADLAELVARELYDSYTSGYREGCAA